MLLWLTLACTTASDSGGGTPTPDELDVTLAAPPAFDPLAGVPLTWTLSGDDAEPDTPGTILDATGNVARKQVLVAEGWDGRNEGGTLLPTGRYTLAVGEGEARRTAEFELVRVGFTDVYAEDDDGVTATRVPLYWHMKRHAQDESRPFSSIDSIDDASGAVVLPAPGTNLSLPEEGTSDPVAYTWDSRPILTLTVSTVSVLGAVDLTAAPLHVSAPGWTVVGDAKLVEGGTITLQRDDALGTTLGVTEETISVAVEATDDAGHAWPVATLDVPWRAYRLLDSPTWEATGDRYQPWVAAIDPALRALEGTPPEREKVLDGLVRWIFEDGGVEYDTTYGASAYTIYQGGDWNRASFDMSGFLARKFGIVVNCTDCAGMVVGFGNMLGAEVEYAIIGWSFNLNYILAIGGDEYTHCPFGGSGCGFYYHAVTTNPDNTLIWDATLALDGDADPSAAPHSELLVQSIDSEEYLDRLVWPGYSADYDYQAQGTLQ